MPGRSFAVNSSTKLAGDLGDNAVATSIVTLKFGKLLSAFLVHRFALHQQQLQ